MNTITLLKNFSLSLAVTGLLLAGPALAKKPEWAGGGQGKGNGNDNSHVEMNQGHGNQDDHGHGQDRGGGDSVRINTYFGSPQRSVVHNYYQSEFHSGHHCPPGLAKKHNGCMPPGQAKKWQIGHPLPRNVIYYDLPPRLVVDLGPPPRGHKYVRVASDILLLAIGTSMVVDSINDLGGM